MKRRAFLGGMTAVGAAAVLHSGWRFRGRAPESGRFISRLDSGWKFLRGALAGAQAPGLDDAAWQPATLPHTARIEALAATQPWAKRLHSPRRCEVFMPVSRDGDPGD